MPTPVLTTVILRTQSDERLVALARGGHERAFETIFNRYRPQLARSLRRYLPAARIDDVLQQAFISAWQSLGKGAEIRDLQPWLQRVARNAALRDLKRPGYDHDELHGAFQLHCAPDDVIEQRDVIRRTLKGVAALPERQRAALLAIAVEGRPSQDVADELGISDPAARQLVARARATLRSAVTAITPSPLLTWALHAGHTAAAGEGVAGAALGAGGAATLIKAGAALTAGIVAISAPVAIEHHVTRKTAPPLTASAPVHLSRVIADRSTARADVAHARKTHLAVAGAASSRDVVAIQSVVEGGGHRHAKRSRVLSSVPASPAPASVPPAATPAPQVVAVSHHSWPIWWWPHHQTSHGTAATAGAAGQPATTQPSGSARGPYRPWHHAPAPTTAPTTATTTTTSDPPVTTTATTPPTVTTPEPPTTDATPPPTPDPGT